MKVKLSLALILIIFVAHAVSLNFIQDDAFISYRYAHNLLKGHGLVFNPGERVEGYTNFMWILLLALLAGLGLNIILASKILGILSGCVAILVLYKLSRLLLQGQLRSPDQGIARSVWLFSLIPPLLLAANGTFAYWSVSGLETAFFATAVLLTVTLYFTNQRLMIVCAALSSLIRPEGVLIFSILILHRLIFVKGSLKTCLRYILGFSILLMPYLIFKISYYGQLLPNPFYAKTGLSIEYLRSGLAYLWLFLSHYGLWGVLYVLPLGLSGHLGRQGKLVPLLVYIYTLYIVIVGGDVLLAHRFFLPLLPFLYFLVSVALMRVHRAMKRVWLRQLTLAFLVVALTLSTFWMPRGWLLNVRHAEVGLYHQMADYARRLRSIFGTDFTLAVSTIGAISYYSEARVIDMLGLTDDYIARHPEQLPGISSAWREKRFNTRYLLSRDPDVIVFSTGAKPSAPAEKALFLSSQFRENYYPYYFFGEDTRHAFFRRKGDYRKTNQVFPDARFVEHYHDALILSRENDFSGAVREMEQVLAIGPPDWSRPHESISFFHFQSGNFPQAKVSALKALAMDDYCTEAHMVMHDIHAMEGDTAVARLENRRIYELNPEMFE